jgi:DNA repair protein RadA/Sms
MLSSFLERPFDRETVVFGEVGLTGEIRPVPFGEERLSEAAKHGFRRALVPEANRPRHSPGLELVPLKRLADAIESAGF